MLTVYEKYKSRSKVLPACSATLQNKSLDRTTHRQSQERSILKQTRCTCSTINLPNISNTTGKVRSVQKVGRFVFAEMQAAIAIHTGIPVVEMRICLHELNTCGNITFRMGHTHWLCNWLSGGACLARGGKGTRLRPATLRCTNLAIAT